MKIVIDIPEELYKSIPTKEYIGYMDMSDWQKIVFAVSSGIVLPIPSVTPKQKMERCKDCKYFEYDSMAKVDGIPLIVAHEVCSKWGGGCKTKEDGYCFLYEPQESEET